MCAPPRAPSAWAAEKARWRSAICRCPAFGDANVVRARWWIFFAIAVLAAYVFVQMMAEEGGVPYYFIYLTNWTGCATVAYATLALLAAREGARRAAEEEGAAPSSSEARGEPTPSPDDDADDASDRDAAAAARIPWPVHALWLVKAIALVCQIFITIMYWALLFPLTDGHVSGPNVVAHGALLLVVLFDFLACNRLAVGAATDLGLVYLFGVVFLLWSALFALGIPGARNTAGEPHVYSVLAWKSEAATAGVVVAASLAVVVPISFALACAVTTARDRRMGPADVPGHGAEDAEDARGVEARSGERV